VKTQSHTNIPIQIAQRQENKMTTEQQQIEALKTLHEAIQALKDLGFITDEEETE
jgi:hypothetical protein